MPLCIFLILLEATSVACVVTYTKGRELTAGEATHSKHIGTVHGACFTGDRGAQRLLQYFHQREELCKGS